jgi:agmatinase
MLADFDPNGLGLNNGNFIGLPFKQETAQFIFFPVPWDVTVSYADGTARGPENILQASAQLDLMHHLGPEEWKKGLFFQPPNTYWYQRNQELRPLAKQYIDFLESGGQVAENKKMQRILEEVNYSSQNLNNWVENQTKALLEQNKYVGLIGGEHSSPLGFLRALSKRVETFGILQIDAHMDLRQAYEGFTYSHASIFYNALAIPNVTKLVQVGIRDYCAAEAELASQDDRIEVFYDHALKRKSFQGLSWLQQCEAIIQKLPQEVYISFDIDGLSPALCPNTGTPVPGGLEYAQANFLLECLINSGRRIIGFDLCEVGGPPNEWDGNVGARIAYDLAVAMLVSQGSN